MKRWFIIALSLNLLCASAAWAVNGCVEWAKNLPQAEPHREGPVAGHHHDGDADHSHSDPSRVHCASQFDEFLLSARTTASGRDSMGQVDWPASGPVRPLTSANGARSFHGPPGSTAAAVIPLHLLLSVLRI